jgi:hypothetical protein
MRDGRAARLEIFPEREKALEAAARQERDPPIGKRPIGA